MTKVLFISLFVIPLLSCSTKEDNGRVIAKVYEDELFEGDIKHLFDGQHYSIEDSTIIANDFINNWTNKQILVHHANKNEAIDKAEIERKVESFKQDLLIMELEQILVSERLDTVVNKDEITTYYNDHQQDFQLNDYLVKVLYLKIPADAPDIDKVGYQYKLYKDSDIEEIDLYAKIYASNYYYDEDNWIYFDDLLKEIPLYDVNKDRFIMKRSKTRFEEGGYYYFLNIIDYKLKNSISPLSFETNNIKERIINIRVKDLREEIKQEIISKAYDNNAITIN